MTRPRTPVDPQALLAHRDFVRAIARSLLWDEHAAEDVVQETWLAALGRRDTPSRSWLGAVSRNISIKRLRSDRRRIAREAVAARPESVPSDEDVRERERLRRSVVDEVLSLAEPYRATVLLRYFENLPPREVARRMSVPVETVRTRTRRAMSLLRDRLDAQHGDDRSALCGALAIWAGLPRGTVGSTGTATVGIGGLIMGTKAVAVGMAVVLGGLAAWLLWPPGVGDVPPEVDVAADSGGKEVRGTALERPRAESRPTTTDTPVDAEPGAEPVIGGHVIDTQGRPVPGLEVCIDRSNAVEARTTGAEPIPPGATRVTTDESGQFEARLQSEETCRVWLRPRSTPDLEVSTAHAREVAPPATEIEFVVQRHPTATLVISAVDGADGARLSKYVCSLGRRVAEIRPSTTDGRTEALVRLDSPSDDVEVMVSAGPASAQRIVSVSDGERVEIRLDLQRDGIVRGAVRDAGGRPVEDALVFFGEEDGARGDEPFKPFDESRVRDGTRTDASGQFEIKGTGRWITVWSPDAGPTTVGRGDAMSVVLAPRGVIRGVLYDSDGSPCPFTRVFLDRVHEATTDGDGRFEFTAVEPGMRGISLTGGKPKAYVAVRVASGEVADVEVRPGIPSVQLTWPGRDDLGRFVVLVPMGSVGSLGVGQPSGGAATVPDLIPGRYAVLGMNGAVAQVEVSGAAAVAEVGTGSIRVHAAPRTRLWVVPEGAGYLARLMAGRMAGGGVPDSGVQEYSGLAPGRYEVGVELDGLRQIVEVRTGTVELKIE